MRKWLGKMFSDRRVVGGLLLIAQFLIVLFGVGLATENWRWLSTLLTVLSIIIVIWLVRKYDNPTYKISWIIIILVLPLFGGLFYLLWGNTPFNRARTQHKYEPKPPDFTAYLRAPATETLAGEHPQHAACARYVQNLDGMPAWTNTETRYFKVGEEMFASMCEELKKAEKFVFMEYFIVEQGVMWDTILDILKEKVRQGVDVRLIYDDVGSIATLPKNYDKYLGTLGIRAVRFNRFIPTLNTYLNYRNHRKIMVIDGNVGYMGGINLADEYINVKVRFGHWKDTGILLRGEGTASITSMFLQMWEYVTGEPVPPLDPYLPTVKMPSDGYVQPFADSPLDDLNIGESVYLQIVQTARDYVYITTPYLVLDNEMITALTIAAQSGVDVRILTPGIPDKKLVYMITRSYYQQLHRAGVKIYEYRPGFLHAKSIVADDNAAVVGTINMDFRSFFLHFECATCFYESSVVGAVKQDILNTIEQSRQIDDEWLRRVPWLRSIAASVLRLFAPLL
ncbi:cardiolipin synthase [Agathobaculum sp.]|uniref:cardiolipin synthase n=1 Tax=Agathobaculum sp. TaxID=2048138 RepID=UPI002A835206|nr:cardiolipin synthase [Agathobaculum sp.]MDY3618331.1 cardiolipin synthase [Agathobaculum sp.]